MAMNGLSNINFGPAFGGFSAAEANNEELANLKMKRLQDMFEANQIAANTEYRDLESDRYRQETPYSVAQERLKGNQADTMNTATMLEKYRLGEVGKSEKSAAEGSKLTRTLESDVVSTNSANNAAVSLQGKLRPTCASIRQRSCAPRDPRHRHRRCCAPGARHRAGP